MRRAQFIIVGAGALALAAALAASALRGPVELDRWLWPATGGFTLLLFGLQQQGFVFRWRAESTKVSLDELGIFLGLLALPPTFVVGAVFAAALATQLVHRRAAWKAAFNTAQYTVAAVAAVAVATALRHAGVPTPWYALAAPVVFSFITAYLVSILFGRLERTSALTIFRQRFAKFVIIASAIGMSLGLISYALFLIHPAAVLAALPVFAYLRRFGRLTEWADDELTTHRLVAGVSAELAGRYDLDHVGARILQTCQELFDCGEASLTLAQEDGAPPRVWHERFSESAGHGGVSSVIRGPSGARVGMLAVFPKPGQARYGEREHQLLRTVAATATAAASNAQAIRAAHASEERYRSLFQTAHVLVHVLDAEGRIVDANPAAEMALGRPRSHLIARSLEDLLGGNTHLLESLRLHGEVVGMECSLQRSDGAALHVLVDAKAIGQGERSFVVFARDITTQKTLERELRRSMAKQHETIKRLENMNRELEEFTLWTTHDMREPLRSIGTVAHFLHDEIDTMEAEEARDMARRIREGADRLKERVKALHAFSRIVQQDDEFGDVDMQRVVADVVASLDAKIAEKGATLDLGAEPFPVVRAQPHRIDQVVANLIENALKHGRSDTPRVEVRVRATATEWRLSVRDDGPGIPPGYHDRIFQLFQRGPGSSEPGSGAGLAIVKRIAEQHGGRAWVESREGEGACFFVALPKPDPAATPLVSLAPARPLAVEALPGPHEAVDALRGAPEGL